MKKLLLCASLVAFLGTSAITTFADNSDSTTIVNCDDKKKCDKKSCCKKGDNTAEKKSCSKDEAAAKSCCAKKAEAEKSCHGKTTEEKKAE